MLKTIGGFWLLGLPLILGTLYGCGGMKRIQNAEVSSKPMSNEAASAPSAVPRLSGHYIVEKNDCLWKIAGQPRVYGNPFQWPILFKTNRDEIKDPDLIYPRQVLKVEEGWDKETRDRARQLAKATPKYVAHDKPRETLPVDYF